YMDLVLDAAGPELHVPTFVDVNIDNADEYQQEEPNERAKKFYKLLQDADEPLWSGCDNHTRLSAVSQLLNLKSEFNLSEKCFDRMIAMIKSMLPKDEKLPENYYRAKKMVHELGLGFMKIDVCPNHCLLYYKEDAEKTCCDICGHSRFKPRRGDNVKQKDVPHKVLRYFPLTPRLQRLYMSSKIAKHMRWHAERVRREENVMNHHADAEAWKHFDRTHPTFSREIRNVRLGLCTDGFNPFGGLVAPYSCWPVFVTPYNLPSSMCMK